VTKKWKLRLRLVGQCSWGWSDWSTFEKWRLW